jgi:general secretion pathway protein I
MTGARKKSHLNLGESSGFTLLEVLVAIAILAIAATVVLSLMSGSLRNIRKVQMRTKAIEHAEAVMEETLLDSSIQQPTFLNGSLPDGSRWAVRVEDYLELEKPKTSTIVTMPVKLMSYSVEVTGPESVAPDCRIQTLKLVKTQTDQPLTRIPQ